MMGEFPILGPDQVLVALRAHPEGATQDDIRYAALPGSGVAWPEDRSNWGDPMSGPARRELVWPDWAQVLSAISQTRRAGWLVREEHAPWEHNAPSGPTLYFLDGRAPLPVAESAHVPVPTGEQATLPETERMIAFLVAAGGGGTPVENAGAWGLRHLGAPNGGDARPWRAMVAELERRGYRVDWWAGSAGMGWVRLADLPPMTVPEVAAYLGLSYPGANDLLRRRGVKEVDRVGNARRFRRADIERLAAEDRRDGRPRMSQPPAGGAQEV